MTQRLVSVGDDFKLPAAVKVDEPNLPTRLSDTALTATYVPKWKPTTAYLAGDKVLSPNGDVVSAVANFTSGASYDASNWSLSPTYATPKDLAKSAPKQATKALATTTAKQQFRKLSLGDSIANMKWRFMYDPLKRAWGGADPGASIGAGESGTGWALPGITPLATTGTINDALGDFDAWFSGVVSRYTTGASRTYGIGGANARWDSAKVYYVKGNTANDGGTFKVQVDGVDETGMTSVATTNASIDLGILTLTRGTAASRALTVVNLTGATRIIGVAFYDSTRGGVINGTVSQGGIPLNSAIGSAGARTTLTAYLTDYQPDIITLEMKEDESYYASALATLFGIIKTAVPTATVVGIGSTPIGNNDASQVTQNAQLKAACYAYGFTYWDGYSPVVDYPTLNALGWAGDGIHVDDRANSFLAGLMLADLRLLSHPALLTSTRGVSAPKVMADSRIDLGKERVDGDPQKVLSIDSSAGSEFDAKMVLRRTLDVLPLSGTFDTNSWRFQPDNAQAQQVPYGVRIGANGPYLQGNTSTLRITDARGGGNVVAIEVDRVKTTKVELATVTTANRPASAPDGMIVYDSTIGKPIIRNGGVWKELTMGATV